MSHDVVTWCFNLLHDMTSCRINLGIVSLVKIEGIHLSFKQLRNKQKFCWHKGSPNTEKTRKILPTFQKKASNDIVNSR